MAPQGLAVKDARIAELEQINTSMCMLLAKIREVSGVGAKPMLYELEYAIAGRIRELEAKCEARLKVIQFWKARDAGKNARILKLEDALRPFAAPTGYFQKISDFNRAFDRAREVLKKGKQE